MMRMETALATVERKSDHFLEVKFKPGALLELPGVLAVHHARERLCPNGGCVVLTRVPADVTYDQDMLNSGLYRPNTGHRHAIAEAIVTPGKLHHTMALLHVPLFPRSFRIEVFSSETAATTWLAARLREAGVVLGSDDPILAVPHP